MSWLIAILGGLAALAIAVLAAVAGMYATGMGAGRSPVQSALGSAAFLLALVAAICAAGGLRAAAKGALPATVAVWAGVPIAGAIVLAAIASLLETLGAA